MREAWNKIEWTAEMDEFLRRNFQHVTNRELAKALGLRLTVVRTRCYELGMKKMNLQYWTDEQVQFLKVNFRYYGDTELAEMFTAKWEKEKGWTKKHIEKKRRYLKLKRTAEERQAIFLRNKENGAWAMCPVNAWKTRGASPCGTVKVWGRNGTPVPYIKTQDGYVKLSRYMYEYHNGPVPNGYNVVNADGNRLKCSRTNLILISNAELMTKNNASVTLTDNYVVSMMTIGRKDLRGELKRHPEIIELKRLQLKLNRQINNGKDSKTT